MAQRPDSKWNRRRLWTVGALLGLILLLVFGALFATGIVGDQTYQMVVAQIPSLKVDTFPLASRPIMASFSLMSTCC